MTLPAQYAWLEKELAEQGGPKAVVEAVRIYGTLERPGTADNPVILEMADTIAERFPSNYNTWASTFYDDDGIAWCGLFAGYCETLAGRAPVDKYLSALAWRKYGIAVPKPMLGDLLIKTRSGGGHVTRYIAEDETQFHCIGGNQGNQVSILRYPKKGIDWSFRRPPYRVQPLNVRVIKVEPGGTAAAGSEA